MLNTLLGIVQKNKIELIEKIDIPEGTKVLITIIPKRDEKDFWLKIGQLSLEKVWDNTEDDIYEKLLKE